MPVIVRVRVPICSFERTVIVTDDEEPVAGFGLNVAVVLPGRPDTLSATALVHEAWLELTKLNRIKWQNRSHYLALDWFD